MGVERVEQIRIARAPLHPTILDVCAGVEPLNYSQNFLRPVRIDEINGTLIVEERMTRMQPKPRFVGCVKIRQALDDVAQIRDDRLGPQIWGTVTMGPPRYGRRRHVNDVGYVLALKSTS